MWNLSAPYWEFVIRAAMVYVFVIFILRFAGKRQIGELSPFDFVLLLLLSNGVQNAMNGGDNTITAGLIITATLVGLNAVIAWLVFRNKEIEKVVEGRPEVLIHNGHLYSEILKRNAITHHELNNALRQNGCTCIDEVRVAVLENNGQISVIKK